MKYTNRQIAIDLLELAYRYIEQDKETFICLVFNYNEVTNIIYNKYKSSNLEYNNNLTYRITAIGSILTEYISNCLGKDKYGNEITTYTMWLNQKHNKFYNIKKYQNEINGNYKRSWAKEGRMQWIKYMIKEIQEGRILQ